MQESSPDPGKPNPSESLSPTSRPQQIPRKGRCTVPGVSRTLSAKTRRERYRVVRRKWRKCRGIEPPWGSLSAPHNGFEDRATHQGRSTSTADISRSLAGLEGLLVGPLGSGS